MTYYTDEQFAQVNEFMNNLIEKIKWIQSPDGVETLSDKCSFDDGTISEQSMMKYVIEFVLEHAETECNYGPSDLAKLLSLSAFRYSMTSYDQDVRDALEPFYKGMNI